ncbi:ESPR-type extended signal peptide-containing protein, partial [Acinetobacter junii]|uniref:ESPR-type extended signal peptide-containing protein n=1 Tax=Acinetobacter junii TaxID=40215 RepID=UPI003AF93838
MNKVYKVVWNASLGIWVAVSELAKGKTKSRCSVEASCSQNQQLEDVSLSSVFKYKILSLAIFTVFTANFAHAGYEAGGAGVGDATTRNNCTRTSTGTNSEAAAIAIANENGRACANSLEAIAIGANIAATADQAIAIGNDVVASGISSVVIGSNFNSNPVTTSGVGGVAIGSGLSTSHGSPAANGQGSIALGTSGTTATGGDGTQTINGYIYNKNGARATGAYSAALLQGSQTKSDRSIAIGVEALADTNAVDSISLGTKSTTSANNTVAIGKDSLATTTDSISLGRNAKSGFGGSSDVNAIAIGADSTSYAYGVALGNGATADQSGFTSVNGGIAIGSAANTEAGTLAGIALGNSAKVSGSAVNSVAIGKDADASVNNSVALGAGSTTTAQAGDSFLTNVGPSTTNGVVSVGTSGATRRIQNVAGGAALTDAVNVAQLDKAYDDAHSRLATALGGGAAYDTNTNLYTPPSYTINKADIGSYAAVTNVGVALSNLNTEIQREITFVGNTGSIGRNLGESLNITGGLAGAGSNSNVKTVISGNTVDIQIANAPNFAGTVTSLGQQVNGNSVITGTSTIGSGADAVTLSGTANGLDVGNKKISNVAAPSAGSDATNKTYVDGKVQALGDTPLGFIGDSGTKATRKLGEDLNVKGGATGTLTNGNIGVVSNGTNQLDIKLAETVNLGANGSVTTGSTVVSNIGVTTPQVVIGTGANTTTLTSNGTSLNVGGDKITNVGNATTASDAVNKGQLDSSLANANSNAAV